MNATPAALADLRRQRQVSAHSVAAAMGIAPADLAVFEARPLQRSSVRLVAKYVHALGAVLEFRDGNGSAVFGEERIVLYIG